MPKTPTAMFESFPLVSIMMTMFMVPNGLSAQLNSSVPMVQIVAAVRTLKCGAVMCALRYPVTSTTRKRPSLQRIH